MSRETEQAYKDQLLLEAKNEFVSFLSTIDTIADRDVEIEVLNTVLLSFGDLVDIVSPFAEFRSDLNMNGWESDYDMTFQIGSNYFTVGSCGYYGGGSIILIDYIPDCELDQNWEFKKGE